jgi:hypothetical protein
MAGRNLFGSTEPTGILQLLFPRIELHLFYTTIVFIPMVKGMYHHMFPPSGETECTLCTCAWSRTASAL